MADTYFAGLRATDDFVTNERPENWRQGLLRLFPNGDMPLTALTSMMKSSPADDVHFHWWTKTLTTQRAAVTNVYTDVGLSSAYTSGGVSGDTVYVKMAAASTGMFRVGHQVLLRDASDATVDVVGKVTGVVSAGASSYLSVRLLEDDDNSSLGDLSDCDTILIIGNLNPQGGTRPEAITQSPTEFSNYTQIFRNSLDLSRTIMATKTRTADVYREAKRDALEQHGIEMEKAFLFGIQSAGTGSNGKPETSTQGLLSWIRSAGVVEDFSLDTDTDYAGLTWVQGGVDWLNDHLEQVFRYGATEKLAFCGSGALLALQKLVLSTGAYQIAARENAFGINVREFVTAFGMITLKTHPLFSFEPTMRNSMMVFEPADLQYRYITDTMFKPDNTDKEGGGTGKDGKEEEFLTEAGLEFHHGEKTGFFTNLGVDNVN